MRRIAVIEKEKCNPTGCGGYLCIRVSPGNRMGKEVFVKGPDGKAQVNEDVCTDAESITVKKCPFAAIHMIQLPDKLTSMPTHRYGKDGFVLYKLPVPLFGQVTGILGVNGVGKSTAVKVIAQILDPNFGLGDKKVGKKESLDKLIQMFKGTEAQVFFEKIRDGKIKIAYKPQAVDAIPKTFKGSVKKLLEEVRSDDGKINEIAEDLEISNVLDTAIDKVSGGELQRVAIAASVLKDPVGTNVYVFDEPTSYLDIKQRIKISKFIRRLAGPEKAIMAVEHDLIILDYLTDSVDIMYGEAGAYGVVSKHKPTRTAINTYLSGYIRDENMRFRDHEIKFEAKPPKKIINKESIVEWEDVEAKLGKFKLTANSGGLPKKHVIGVLGENGVGKTSFVKLLTGEIKSDKGKVSSKVSISYKPQYIHNEQNAEVIVSNLLGRALADPQLMLGLDLQPLLMKKVSELSGGELQRVMVARCLGEDADLFLLDEPSAYLDIEQRMAVSKLIRERMDVSGRTALVIDHDLLVIDYISDMLMVFEGEPAKSGEVHGPFKMEEGMNKFLSGLDITLRRDKDSQRPRINSHDSRLDREQKSTGKFYYSS
jgi:ATP-binding cassette, sub-family E, member 1